MATSILQSFLNNQFIKTAEGENIENLKKAAAAVKAKLAKKKDLTIPYTLVALDPLISSSDPVVLEVEGMIIKFWSGFRNSVSTTKDKATTYVRVVILEALSQLAKDEIYGGIIWLSGRNIIGFYKTGKEQNPLAELMIDLGDNFEEQSIRNWSLSESAPKNTSLPESSFPSPSSKGRIDPEELTAELMAAAVYSGWSHQAGGGENPYYAHSGNVHWSKFFAERAGSGIAPLINKAFESQNKSLSELGVSYQKVMQDSIAKIMDVLASTAKIVNQASVSANKRAELLWWKQTLYSSSLNNSYRKLTISSSVITMAMDLSGLLGLLYPESVNYLLREALYDIFGDKVYDLVKFEILLDQMQQEIPNDQSLIRSYHNSLEVRKPCLSALASFFVDNDKTLFFDATGIDSKAEICLADFAVWLLNDIQAFKLSDQK